MTQPDGEEGTTLEASVVMPLYNGAETLADQLDALSGQDFAGTWELIVADNLSTDGGPVLAQQWQSSIPGLRVVSADQRQSPSHARNVGAGAASGRLLVFCDSDDMVDPGWLSAMVSAGHELDLFGGVREFAQLNEPTIRQWYRGDVAVVQDPPVDFGRDRRDRGGGGLPVSRRFLPYAVGANMGVSKEVFDALGGFDESFERAAGDDVELSWRAALAQYRLGFVPDSVVHYRLRRSIRAMMRQQYRRGMVGPQLYRNFRDAGMPRRTLRSSARDWASLVWRLADLFGDEGHRGRWLVRAAYASGQLVGSVKLHVRYL